MTRVTQMIRIQLVREGHVVKQITSRVHESVVLELINKFKDPYDEIVIVEGDLSEDARGMLKHVARKVVPAALAAGMALGSHGASADNRSQNYGNQGTPGINRHFPSLDYSPGQYLQQAVLNARSGGAISRSPAPQTQYQSSPVPNKVYDQSRVSQDGRFYIMYDMDNKISRVPVQGTDFMSGDSQRMPHYITANGQVMYVRHPHNNGLGESVKKIIESALSEGEFGSYYSEELAQKVFDQNPNLSTSGRADEYFDAAWPFMVADLGEKRAASIINSEDFPMDTVSAYSHLQKQGVAESDTKAEHDKGYADASNGIAKNPYNPGSPSHSAYEQGQQAHKRHFGESIVDEGSMKDYLWDKAASMDKNAFVANADEYGMTTAEAAEWWDNTNGVDEGMGTIGTTPTIPTSNSAPNPANKTQFNPTGKTTNATFNAQGQLEIEDEDKEGLSPQALDALKKAGVEIAESTDDELQAILSQYADSYTAFKEGGDIDENQDFFDALFDYYSDMGEEDGGMPYGTQKARDGDPYQWISDRLNALDNAPVVEADDEATAADQGAADKNIIMQIRKASDYEKPYALELSDGNSITITAATASKILAQFDRLKPASKELMQQTLNSIEGFREMLNYFNEREVNESDISIAEQATIRARLLIKSVFGV